ncbi:MAG: hypothetical protein Q7T18_00795, partial [Sedimentisphaerales bacterium]|nr:hypothetical protein [Sedimentisphaerales bacterium]
MKKSARLFVVAALLMCACGTFGADPNCDPSNDEVGRKTLAYFNDLFGKMAQAAQEDPNYDSFRKIMKPVAEEVKGFYGGTLVDPDFVIRQVYYPSHFLARGYDLKKVKELTEFYKTMKEKPSPQLSEPGHGSLVQPRLIAMRYPVIVNGKFKNIVSMMVRTDEYLKAAGLDE